MAIQHLLPDDPAVMRELSALCATHHVRRLSLFGSGVTGEMTGASDLDFLVEFQPLPAISHADAYFGLLAGLESLLGRRIDLLERSAIENPFLLRGIERSRRLVYEEA